MRSFIRPRKDSTIYETYDTYNGGLDEILEVGKLTDPVTNVSYTSASVRALIDFDISGVDTGSRFFLNLYVAHSTEFRRYQKIEVSAITSEWVEGSGYRYQDVTNVGDGVTWLQRDQSTSWSLAGGDFNPTPTASFEFVAYPLEDVRIDVSSVVSPFTSSGTFYGLMVKFPNEDERDGFNKGNVKFFSSNTHTVFEPFLEIARDDQEFSTGSLDPIPSSNINIAFRNLKKNYSLGEIDELRLVVRDKYPRKRFDGSLRYENVYYLPQTSYYRIVDEVSNVEVVPYDNYSKINCDPSGSYISLDTSGLYRDRYYRLEIKIVDGNKVYYPNIDSSFRVL